MSIMSIGLLYTLLSASQVVFSNLFLWSYEHISRFQRGTKKRTLRPAFSFNLLYRPRGVSDPRSDAGTGANYLTGIKSNHLDKNNLLVSLLRFGLDKPRLLPPNYFRLMGDSWSPIIAHSFLIVKSFFKPFQI